MKEIGPKAYIYLNRLRYNLECIQKRIGNRKIVCVVKANGYGHGSIKIAKAISDYSNVQFGVFTIEEALELRSSGIKNDIIVFSRLNSYTVIIASKNNIILSLGSLEDIEIIKSCKLDKNSSFRYHIKFDTGMTRLGVDISDAELLYKKINKELKIFPEGIYTHFATADEGDISYAKKQLEEFKRVVSLANQFKINIKYIHSSNSGAILNLSDSYFNMVRVGMLLYGALPSNEVPLDFKLKPVMAFCGTIVNIRKVPKKTRISYGGIYITKVETYIGVIQTGFADGFPRPWYEKGYISYFGEKYKIAGRICMDQFMVDFGDTNPNIGDDVLFFGDNESDKIPVEDIANSINSTPYVLLTAIGGRTKYFYRN